MPMTYRACVVVVYMFDMSHTTVTCYTVSRDQARCRSTVHLNLKKTLSSRSCQVIVDRTPVANCGLRLNCSSHCSFSGLRFVKRPYTVTSPQYLLLSHRLHVCLSSRCMCVVCVMLGICVVCALRRVFVNPRSNYCYASNTLQFGQRATL